MAKKSIGILQAALRLEASQFRKELKGSAGAFVNFAKTFAVPAAAVAGAATAMAGAVKLAGEAFAFVREEMDKIESVGRVADGLGLAIEELSAMQLAAGDSGVSLDKLNMAVQRMNRRLGDAMRGVKEAQAVFEMFGIDPAQFARLGTAARLEALGIRILSEETTALSKSVKMFDSEAGRDMLAWFRDTNGQVRDQINLYKDLGLVMDQEGYEKAKNLNAAMAMGANIWADFKRDVAVAITGTSDLASAMQQLAFYTNAVAETLKLTVEYIKQYGGPILEMVDVLTGLDLNIIPSGVNLLSRQSARARSESQIGTALDRALDQTRQGNRTTVDVAAMRGSEQGRADAEQKRLDQERNRTLNQLVGIMTPWGAIQTVRF